MSGSWNPDLVEGESNVDRDMMPRQATVFFEVAKLRNRTAIPIQRSHDKIVFQFGESSPLKKMTGRQPLTSPTGGSKSWMKDPILQIDGA